MGLLDLFRRSRNGEGKETEEWREATEVRLARLARDVREAVQRIEGLEANSLDRTAAILNATDKLNRASERYRKHRTANASGSDDGDAEHDWLSAYHALRGRGAGPAPHRSEVNDDDENNEDGE